MSQIFSMGYKKRGCMLISKPLEKVAKKVSGRKPLIPAIIKVKKY
jgi:hypothetical protein